MVRADPRAEQWFWGCGATSGLGRTCYICLFIHIYIYIIEIRFAYVYILYTYINICNRDTFCSRRTISECIDGDFTKEDTFARFSHQPGDVSDRNPPTRNIFLFSPNFAGPTDCNQHIYIYINVGFKS